MSPEELILDGETYFANTGYLVEPTGYPQFDFQVKLIEPGTDPYNMPDFVQVVCLENFQDIFYWDRLCQLILQLAELDQNLFYFIYQYVNDDNGPNTSFFQSNKNICEKLIHQGYNLPSEWIL